MNALSFLLRRARARWQLLLTLSLGVLLATGLLASGPLLVQSVVGFGLRHTLASNDITTRGMRLSAVAASSAPGSYPQTDAGVQEVLRQQFGPYLRQIVPEAGTPWLFPWIDGAPLQAERVNISFYGDMPARVSLVAGLFPDDPVLPDEPAVLRVAIGEELAEAYALSVGDRLPLSPNRQAEAPTLWLEIAGIVRPLDPADPFWFGNLTPLRSRPDDRWDAQHHAFVPAESFFAVASAHFVGSRPELHWNVTLDPDRISLKEIPLLQERLDGLIFALMEATPTRPVIESRLGDVLAKFAAQSAAVQAPLLLLTAEVVLLALYYVVMVAALAVKQVEREFAVLRSRGASGGQVFRLQRDEALLICLVAWLSGPVLGAALVRSLALLGPLADVGRVVGQDGWRVSLSGAAWLAAGTGAAAALGGQLIPALSAVRRSIVGHLQAAARDIVPPWWQRAYLDVVLLLLALALLWRLRLFAGIVGQAGGAPRVDWLLLLAPLALLLGAGTILLRLFPLVLRLAAALAARGSGLPAALAMWQVSRNPTHVARLVLLLTLAMALGLLSTGLNATLDLSEAERAQYAAGSDVRLVAPRSLPIAALAQLPGVAQASPAWRDQGSVAQGRTSSRFNLLAIEPATFARVAQFRQDFASQPVEQLLARLQGPEGDVSPLIPLPGRPGRIGLWVWSPPEDPNARLNSFLWPQGDSDLDRIALNLKVVTAAGQWLSIRLDPVERGGYPPGGWRYFDGSLPALATGDLPLSLHSIWLRNQAQTGNAGFARFIAWEMGLALDDLTVTDRDTGQAVVAEGFDDVGTIWFAQGSSFTSFDPSRTHSGAGRLDLHLSLERKEVTRLSLASHSGQEEAMPALLDSNLQQATGLQPGSLLRATVRSESVTFSVAGVVRYFPTLFDDLEGGYLITSQPLLLAALNERKIAPLNVNELFISLQPGEDGEEFARQAATTMPAIGQAVVQNAVRASIKADPMALGLRSVTFFGYVVTTTLSLVGFATHFYLSARQRSTSYAVLRSLGLSSGQLYLALILEQLVLIFFGLALGTALGMLLNSITLPGLPITLGETPPIPPFVPRSDWLAVGRIYLFLALAFLLALGVATWLLFRARLHRALRIGEE